MTSPVTKTAFIAWEDVFTAAELDAIERYGDGMLQHKAEIAAGRGDHDDIRITQIVWIEPNPQTAAIYERVKQMAGYLNAQVYRYEVTGLEPFQYTVYNASEAGHYDWHVDYGTRNPPRKISFSIQLTDAEAYEGCDLQFQAGPKIGTAPRKRGTVIAFPSFFLHRVTPILSGTRKVLVVWATGPEFR